MMDVDRRELLKGLAGLTGAAMGPRGVSAQTALTRLILLGTGGGPRPRIESSASGMLQKVPAARLVVLPAMSHIGISGQSELLARAAADALAIFITHHHSDQRRLRQPDLAGVGIRVADRGDTGGVAARG